MAANSGIEWTEATWNCLAGCEAVSPGCAHCYAATMTRRLEAMGQADYSGLTTAKHFNGTVRCLPHKLDIPLKRRKPTTYFVNSMSDLFHESVPDEFIAAVFGVMAMSPDHTFQVLTKRAQRMAEFFSRFHDGDIARNYPWWINEACSALDAIGFETFGIRLRPSRETPDTRPHVNPPLPLQNIWLGVSCEDQQRADERIPWLLKTPAAVRFLSCEPLLGPIEFSDVSGRSDAVKQLGKPALDGIDWVIVGGESGGGSRPCNVAWIRSIVEQCLAAGVPCFVKQLGAHVVCRNDEVSDWLDECAISLDDVDTSGSRMQGDDVRVLLGDRKGGEPSEWPSDLRVRLMPSLETVQ